MVSIAAICDAGCGVQLRITGLEPAVGLYPAADHTSNITCCYLPDFYTGIKLYCVVTGTRV